MNAPDAHARMPVFQWVADVLEIRLAQHRDMDDVIEQFGLVAHKVSLIAPAGLLVCVHPDSAPVSDSADLERLFAAAAALGLADYPVAIVEPREAYRSLREANALEALDRDLVQAVFADRTQALIWLRHRER